jgi:hypothetical protein
MNTDRNIYKPLRAKLTEVIDESPLIKTFVLIPENDFSFETASSLSSL